MTSSDETTDLIRNLSDLISDLQLLINQSNIATEASNTRITRLNRVLVVLTVAIFVLTAASVALAVIQATSSSDDSTTPVQTSESFCASNLFQDYLPHSRDLIRPRTSIRTHCES